MECVRGLAAVDAWVRQRAGYCFELYDGAGPAVGHDQRNRIRLGRAYLCEVHVCPGDGRHELGPCVES
jgi:hypothetical protein